MAIRNRLRPLAYESLPEGYTRCEYLESTGTQYIDTGVYLSNESEVRCDFLSSEYIQYGALFGARDGAIENTFVFFANVNGIARFDFTPAQISLLKLELNKLYSVLANKSVIIINEVKRAVNTGVVFECSHTCLAFGINSYGSPMLSSSRIYSFSISRNNQLQLNFIPALDPSGRPCMFDLVTQTPFYNQSTTGPDFLYKTYSYPFNPPDNWHTVNKKIKEIVSSTKYTLELIEDGE